MKETIQNWIMRLHNEIYQERTNMAKSNMIKLL